MNSRRKSQKSIMMPFICVMCGLFLTGSISETEAEISQKTTVIYQGLATTLEKTLPDANDLWISPKDMTRINGFVLKPEGLCLDELCIPLLQDKNNDSYIERDGQKWLSLTELARKTQQAYVRDAESGTWSFGEFPPTRSGFLESAMAPDFALRGRDGKTVRLSDFRGKKVLLVTWASWCGCRFDVPAWQPIYEDLKDQGFELISVAEDTGGEAVAGPIFDAANVSYTTLVDPNHRISSLYNFVNVPSAAWIDEEGRIVRINEGTYSKKYGLGQMSFGTNDYAPALRDWVKNGSQSEHVWDVDQVAKKIRPKTSDEAKAEALFELGIYFYDRKNLEKADSYWTQAQALHPDSWNMHRQDWALTEPGNANSKWFSKVQSSNKPYYAELELK